ncbi:GIY-YIG nuclease family protein [Neolewinella antarctica]|uniref:Endonuclease n=1 Tax=Neolewinella antarctica TaxID=442734 RepID=A0ABX0X8B7_9BACT|nr:GIY-YIG nuclease family protein [Neolewinella antarctica]NJC25451.1 putative endonuclease [Neolewinella antarctica]
MSFVYILYSTAIDKYYVGYTKDLDKRVLTHQTDEGGWTSGKGPWELMYYECYESDTVARKREIKLKKSKNQRYLKWLTENGPGSSVG